MSNYDSSAQSGPNRNHESLQGNPSTQPNNPLNPLNRLMLDQNGRVPASTLTNQQANQQGQQTNQSASQQTNQLANQASNPNPSATTGQSANNSAAQNQPTGNSGQAPSQSQSQGFGLQGYPVHQGNPPPGESQGQQGFGPYPAYPAYPGHGYPPPGFGYPPLGHGYPPLGFGYPPQYFPPQLYQQHLYPQHVPQQGFPTQHITQNSEFRFLNPGREMQQSAAQANNLAPPLTQQLYYPYTDQQMEHYRNQQQLDWRNADRWYAEQRDLKYRRTEDTRRGYQYDNRGPATVTSKIKMVPLDRLVEYKFELKRLRVENCPVQGLQGLANRVKELIANKKLIMQETRALVVMNASGVGKTFGSLAVETILNAEEGTQDGLNSLNRYYMPLYIGFNHRFSLTGPEIDLLKDTSVTAYERVCGVIGRRLIYQLRALDSTKGSLSGVLKDQTHWLAKTPQPANYDTFETVCLFPRIGDNDNGLFLTECARLIGKLAERCEGRRLSVLLIIDEGQFLDEYVQPDATFSGGARLALHFCRRLQLVLESADVESAGRPSLLPIMTGINPVTALPDGTTGKNVALAERLLQFADYHNALKDEVAVLNSKETQGYPLKPKEVLRIAALLYPVLRDAIRFVRQQGLEVNMPQAITPLWLVATCGSCSLERKYWDSWVPAVFDGTDFVPQLSLAQFVKMLPDTFLRLSVVRVLQKMAIQFTKLEEVETTWLPGGFEEYAFYVQPLLFAMANVAPVTTDFSDYNGITASKSWSKYEACRTALRGKFRWLENSFKNVAHALRTGTTSICMPSCCTGTHDEAFNVKADGTCEHKLYGRLAELIKDSLKDSGDCFALWCGGNAPIDFIWIIRKSAKDAGTVDVEVCLADAKHKSKSKEVVSPTDTSGKNQLDMPTKFLLVADYLEAALKAECGMAVVQERFAIITSGVAEKEKAYIITNRAACKAGHKNMGATVIKNFFEDRHVYARFEPGKKDSTRGEVVEILTPDTFNIPPLSDLLFGPRDW